MREHLGLIFVYLGEGEPPELPFGAFSRPGIVNNVQFEMPCNWWQSYENVFDEAHAAFVHSRSGSHADLGRGAEVETEITETAYGFDRRTGHGHRNRGARETRHPHARLQQRSDVRREDRIGGGDCKIRCTRARQAITAPLAAGLGAWSARVERADAFLPALDEALAVTATGRPALIEVMAKNETHFSRPPFAPAREVARA